MQYKEKEKEQKTIQKVMSLFYLLLFLIPGLDYRFGWSSLPVLISIIFAITFLVGYYIFYLVLLENPWAARTIEIEKEQKVVSTGLYKNIRHPMYSGVLLILSSSPLVLGSYWGLIPMFPIIVGLIYRILNEEKILKRDLPGYEEYCKKNRYRLIPYIW